jgi:hypothetical protein
MGDYKNLAAIAALLQWPVHPCLCSCTTALESHLPDPIQNIVEILSEPIGIDSPVIWTTLSS